MRYGLLAKCIAVRTDSGARDCPEGGWIAQLRAQDSVGSERCPRHFRCMWAMDERGIHVNAGSGSGPEFARIGVYF